MSKSKGAAFYVATKQSTIRAIKEGSLKDATVALEKARAVGEHPFQIVKQRFDYAKVRYRGIRKYLAKPEILFALANLVLAKREILAMRRA